MAPHYVKVVSEVPVDTSTHIPDFNDLPVLDDVPKNDSTEITTTETKFTPHVLSALSKYYGETELTALQSSLSEVESRKLHETLLNTTTGAYSSIPRLCTARRCPSAHSCPFMIHGLESKLLGKKCALEIVLIDGWRSQYEEMVKDHGIELDIVVSNYVAELIECDIITMRMNHYLAQDTTNGGEIVSEPFLVNPKTGELEYHNIENLALSIKGFVSVRREKAIKALIASPFWRKKMTNETGVDDLRKNLDIFSRAKEAKSKSKEHSTEASYTVVANGEESVVY